PMQVKGIFRYRHRGIDRNNRFTLRQRITFGCIAHMRHQLSEWIILFRQYLDRYRISDYHFFIFPESAGERQGCQPGENNYHNYDERNEPAVLLLSLL